MRSIWHRNAHCPEADGLRIETGPQQTGVSDALRVVGRAAPGRPGEGPAAAPHPTGLRPDDQALLKGRIEEADSLACDPPTGRRRAERGTGSTAPPAGR